jgi:hypothetical protein
VEIKDVFGVGPVAEAGKRVVDSTINGAAAFLSRICLPAAEEFGLLLKDKVKAWRASNAIKIAVKAERMHAATTSATETHAHPRLVGQIIEYGSWSDSTEVQSMWAGLLASSCTVDGQDDSNLMFIDILSRLTLSQIRIIDYACKTARVQKIGVGLIYPDRLMCTPHELKHLTQIDDLHRLDLELDHLRVLGLLTLIDSGFAPYQQNEVGLTPSPLALQMYARCNGFIGDPVHYYAKLGTLTSNESAV